MEASLWRYSPDDTTALAVRLEPSIDGRRNESVLQPNEIFGVSEELKSPNGILYLKLADGRGWVFDTDPAIGTVCVREKPGSQRSLDLQEAHTLVGTWRYGTKGGKYQISLTEWGQLRFDEQPPSGRRAYGFLEPAGQWFQAELNYHDGEPVGTIRLCYMEEQSAILSNFRNAGKTDWQPDLTSHKRRQVLPTVLENDLAAEEDEDDCSTTGPTTSSTTELGLGPAPAAEQAVQELQGLSAGQPTSTIQDKGCHNGEEAVTLAARHADMMLQLLREAQRDRDITQQRLTEVEGENAQLRQGLSAREAQCHELAMERDSLLAQLKDSRAQVEGLLAVCKEPRLTVASQMPEERTGYPASAASLTPATASVQPVVQRPGVSPQSRPSRQQSIGGGEEQPPAVKIAHSRVCCQTSKSYEGIPSKAFEGLQAKSYDGIPCVRTAPSSPPTPVSSRIVKTVSSQPVRIIQVPTPVRGGLRVASRERARYSWQSCAGVPERGARALSPPGC